MEQKQRRSWKAGKDELWRKRRKKLQKKKKVFSKKLDHSQYLVVLELVFLLLSRISFRRVSLIISMEKMENHSSLE
jgi:hypothetical protein